MEKIKIRTREGQAKALGISICMAGAAVIGLYKGASIANLQGSILDTVLDCMRYRINTSSFVSWKIGALCLLGNCATWAIWFVAQTPVLRDFPAQLSSMTFMYAFGTIQLAIIAVCVERDLAVWASTLYSDLATILYAGIVTSGVGMTLQGWCAHRGGPVLIAAYQPLQAVLVAILSCVFIKETLYFGSVLGGLFIVGGLYLVIWGKSREMKVESKALERSNENVIVSTNPIVLMDADQGILAEPLLDHTVSSISSCDET